MNALIEYWIIIISVIISLQVFEYDNVYKYLVQWNLILTFGYITHVYVRFNKRSLQ